MGINTKRTQKSDSSGDVDHGAVADGRLSKSRLFLILFGLGLLGIFSLALQPIVLPEGIEIPLSEPMVRLLTMVQPAILLAVMVLIGVRVAPRVHLRAPAIEALATGQAIWRAFKPQIVPGLVGGLIGALILSLYGGYQYRTVPDIVAASGNTPMLTRVLYGGITEELITRWGVMSLVLWGAWRLLGGRNRANKPAAGVVWGSNVLAALLFGILHLPAAISIGLSSPLWIGLVIGTNTLVGLIYGWLYWRKGLEAAMLAHGLTHVVALWVLLPLVTTIFATA